MLAELTISVHPGVLAVVATFNTGNRRAVSAFNRSYNMENAHTGVRGSADVTERRMREGRAPRMSEGCLDEIGHSGYLGEVDMLLLAEVEVLLFAGGGGWWLGRERVTEIGGRRKKRLAFHDSVNFTPSLTSA